MVYCRKDWRTGGFTRKENYVTILKIRLKTTQDIRKRVIWAQVGLPNVLGHVAKLATKWPKKKNVKSFRVVITKSGSHIDL